MGLMEATVWSNAAPFNPAARVPRVGRHPPRVHWVGRAADGRLLTRAARLAAAAAVMPCSAAEHCTDHTMARAQLNLAGRAPCVDARPWTGTGSRSATSRRTGEPFTGVHRFHRWWKSRPERRSRSCPGSAARWEGARHPRPRPAACGGASCAPRATAWVRPRSVPRGPGAGVGTGSWHRAWVGAGRLALRQRRLHWSRHRRRRATRGCPLRPGARPPRNGLARPLPRPRRGGARGERRGQFAWPRAGSHGAPAIRCDARIRPG